MIYIMEFNNSCIKVANPKANKERSTPSPMEASTEVLQAGITYLAIISYIIIIPLILGMYISYKDYKDILNKESTFLNTFFEKKKYMIVFISTTILITVIGIKTCNITLASISLCILLIFVTGSAISLKYLVEST